MTSFTVLISSQMSDSNAVAVMSNLLIGYGGLFYRSPMLWRVIYILINVAYFTVIMPSKVLESNAVVLMSNFHPTL